MRIAVIVERDLVGSGFGTRVSTMLQRYADVGHTIDLVQIGTKPYAYPVGLQSKLHDYVHFPLGDGRMQSHMSLRPSRVVRCEQSFNAAWDKVQMLTSRSYAIVQAETTNVWPVARTLRAKKRILVLHDDDSSRLRSLSRVASSPIRRLVYTLDSLKFASYQLSSAANADQCWFVSESELKRFQERGRTIHAVLVPNGAADSLFTIAPLSAQVKKTVLFVGPYGYEANRQGIEWFATNVWPLVLDEVPKATLRVVGGGWHESGISTKGVDLAGYVDDLLGEYTSANVVIAPVFAGGGTNIKVVEAMAAARPVVSTALGARGIPPSAGLRTADDPQSFSGHLVRLLTEGASACECGLANRVAVAGMGWSTIWDNALKLLET